MKKLMRLFSLLCLCAVTVAMGCATSAPREGSDARNLPDPPSLRRVKPIGPGFQPATAEIRALKGRAWVAYSGSHWVPLRARETLEAGSVVAVERNSHVDIFLGRNGPLLRATAGTVFAINALALKESESGPIIDTEFFLQRGRLLGNVDRLHPASRYRVMSPAGQAEVK